jgi:peptidyl-tRNA hydrolase, PTH1 family
MTMKLIVGLGNPGPQYAANRHNIGFQCVERFARRHRIELSKLQQRTMTGDGWVERNGQRQRVLLAKPLTYMNASGQAVAALLRFYKIELTDLIVVHDDIDLAQGRLRLRLGGSSGGQNGIKSIIEQTGSAAFVRAKVGVGRPPGKMDPAAFVLQDFTAAEEEIFGPLREKVSDALFCWLFDGLETAMNRFNG